MVNWPLAGAMGVVGFQANSGTGTSWGPSATDRREPRPRCARRRGPAAALAVPARRARPPSGCRTTAVPRRSIPNREEVLEALVLVSSDSSGALNHHVADNRDLHLDTVVRPQLALG